MKLTPGKVAGLRALSDARGVIAAAAMDQRGSLQKALAKERGGEVSDAMMAEFKTAVTEVLSPHASAILLDPEWGLGAAKRRAPTCGLLLAYEQSGYDNTRPGRQPDLLPGWSVRRLREAGAQAIKVLIYYTPFDSRAVNDEKHAFVERIGDECRANDIPFFLEFVGYDHEGGDEKGRDFALKKPEIVARSMAEFTKDRYGVDVMKVEVPVNLKFVEGTRAFAGERAYSRREALEAFRRAAEAATRPFIYLSAGVSNAEFTESLELAAEAGVRFNGVLCGRATWKDGIPVYAKQGLEAFRRWLETEGVRNIQNVNARLQAAAPWYEAYGVATVEALA
ncbi:MAG TPA: tagatose 1,6-diphosphate aldolase [Vicinamibacterales bacterium]|nr:tagatose 1,6-diphosphate aldolase [Vicinamibacterales bacterium]